MRIYIDDDEMGIVPETTQDKSFLKLYFGINRLGDKIIGELKPVSAHPSTHAIIFKTKEEK